LLKIKEIYRIIVKIKLFINYLFFKIIIKDKIEKIKYGHKRENLFIYLLLYIYIYQFFFINIKVHFFLFLKVSCEVVNR